MKNYSIIGALSALILCTTASLNAKVGCIDTSLNLTKRFDTKVEHFVSCNCPCNEYPQTITKQNLCLKCSHQHQAPRMEFTTGAIQGNAEAARWMALYQLPIAIGK